MNKLLTYILKVLKGEDAGTLENNPDPPEPTLGTELTQDDIDFIKKLKAEFERFDSPPMD